MKRLIFLGLILILAASVSASDSIKRKNNPVKYHVILKDSITFNNAVNDRTIYLITEFARIKVMLSEIDSVEIGIIPDFHNEQKIINLLLALNSDNPEVRNNSFKKLKELNINALPIIRNYIEYAESKKISSYKYEYNPQSAFNELIQKYKVRRDFVDKDLIYLHDGFKLAGILSVKKSKAFLKLGSLKLQRENLNKIIILHETKL
jgi:hypothetical protein